MNQMSNEQFQEYLILKEKKEKLKEYKRNYMREYMYIHADVKTRKKRTGPRNKTEGIDVV
jgi:rRNA processing protein Gar1